MLWALAIAHAVLRRPHCAVDPQQGGLAKSSPLLHALLASGNSALYTALVYITSSRKLDILFPLHYIDYMHCSTDITRLNDNPIPFETPPRNTPIVDVCSASMRLHPPRSSCTYASGPSNLFYPLIVPIKNPFPGAQYE